MKLLVIAAVLLSLCFYCYKFFLNKNKSNYIVNEIIESKDTDELYSVNDFWVWFLSNEANFFKTVKNNKAISENFFSHLKPALAKYHEDIFYVTGMMDDNRAELILTPDGDIKNVAFIEDLIEAAPVLPNWVFTALKKEHNTEGFKINAGDLSISTEKLFYKFIESKEMLLKNELEIIFSKDSKENTDDDTIRNYTYIFLDNYLGEKSLIEDFDFINISVRDLDTINFTDFENIETLKSTIKNRKLKYKAQFDELNDIRLADTDNDSFSSFELSRTIDEINYPVISVLNNKLLEWDKKPSHPWFMEFVIGYNGQDFNGMPNKAIQEDLNEIEDEILETLIDTEGYLNIGRETGANERVIMFACHDYRLPTKVFYKVQQQHNNYKIKYSIDKDTYWEILKPYYTNF